MRFIIHELAYERPLASGRFRYDTGLIEHWRLTTAADGYQFLRVDFDGRAATGESFIAHLTLDGDGRTERVSFRYWADGPATVGNLLLAGRTATLALDVGPERWEDELILPAGYRLWLPTAAGLGLLLRDEWERATAALLPTRPPFRLNQVELRRELNPADGSVTVQGWTAWLNKHGWPERVVVDDVAAVDGRAIWYQ
jgi:hypothetical protein